MAISPVMEIIQKPEQICIICSKTNVKMHCILNGNLQEIYEILSDNVLDPDGPSTVCYLCHPMLKKCGAFCEMARANSKVFDNKTMDVEGDIKPNLVHSLSYSEQNFLVIESTTPAVAKQQKIYEQTDSGVVKDEIIVEEEQLIAEVVNAGELVSIDDDVIVKEEVEDDGTDEDL